MFKEIENKPFIIAGPCAAESEAQVRTNSLLIKESGVAGFRSSLWKPRTKPGFDGVGENGIPWIKEVCETGLIASTEVLVPEHARNILKSIDSDLHKIIIWLGSRNQNHLIQREIASVLQESGNNNCMLMIKNQPWSDEAHWLGILDHVLSTGLSENKILLCHRGFQLGTNSMNFRNVPDFEMAMRIKEKTGRPMIFDPSHVGGTVDNVFKATKMAIDYSFDGFIVEVHNDKKQALTDKNQQLDFANFDQWLNLVCNTKLLY